MALVKNNSDRALLRILIIEDESLVRVTLVETLRHLGVKFVASASDAFSALKAAAEFRPDAIICDIDLGAGPDGVDIAHAMRAKNPKLGVVFLTSLSDPRLKNTGTRGLPTDAIYLKKSDINRSSILLDALFSLTDVKSPENPAIAPAIKLTGIQIEILKMVATGLSNAEIASIRGITVKSTENAIARLAKTLKVKDERNANQRVLLTRFYFELIGKISKAS